MPAKHISEKTHAKGESLGYKAYQLNWEKDGIQPYRHAIRNKVFKIIGKPLFFYAGIKNHNQGHHGQSACYSQVARGRSSKREQPQKVKRKNKEKKSSEIAQMLIPELFA